jgi:alkaline phosphatase D
MMVLLYLWATLTYLREQDRHEYAAALMRGKVLEFSTSPFSMSVSVRYLPPFCPLAKYRTWANRFYIPIFRTFSQQNGAGKTGEDIAIKCTFFLPWATICFTTNSTLVSDIPHGQIKYSTFEVDTRNATEPTVTTRVYIDGKEAWKCVQDVVPGESTPTISADRRNRLQILGKPIRPPTLALGSLSQSLVELLGLKRPNWL